VALGEAVVGEGGHLGEDLLGDVAGDPALGHPVEQSLLQAFHPRTAALGPHRLTQLICFCRGEARNVDGHLHQLLLEQRHAERLGQRVLEQRVQIRDRLESVATADVWMHRTSLDRPGADERHLHNEVVKRARLEPRQRGHLRTRLHLEHTHGVGTAKHVVDLHLLRDGGEVYLVPTVLGDEVHGVVQRAEHAEAEQVELHET